LFCSRSTRWHPARGVATWSLLGRRNIIAAPPPEGAARLRHLARPASPRVSLAYLGRRKWVVLALLGALYRRCGRISRPPDPKTTQSTVYPGSQSWSDRLDRSLTSPDHGAGPEGVSSGCRPRRSAIPSLLRTQPGWRRQTSSPPRHFRSWGSASRAGGGRCR
jgi:hypothetical protein